MSDPQVAGPGPRAALRYWSLLARNPLAGYLALYRDFGDAVRVPFSRRRAFYLLSRPEHAEQILVQQQDSFVKAFTYRPLRLFLGSGSLTSEGETWRRHRRLVQPVFAHRNITRFAGDMVDIAQRRMRTWTAGEVVDAAAEMRTLTMDVVGRVLFGTDFAGDAARIGKSLATTQRAAVVATFLPLPDAPEASRAVAARLPKLGRAVTTMDELATRIIAARRAEPTPAEPRDLLDLLIAGHNGYALSDDELRDEVITLVLAGHETTATALAWTLMLLSQFPAARDRLEGEVDEVLAGREPVADDVDKLVWTQAVVSESMRLFPPAWTVERDLLTDLIIGGIDVPAGSTVAVPPYLVHRNPDIWPNPEGFDPERFLPGAANGRPKYSYIPFGGGRRICVGASFAQLEATLVLATLAGSYRLELAPGVRPVPRAEVTLHPRGPMPMIPTPR